MKGLIDNWVIDAPGPFRWRVKVFEDNSSTPYDADCYDAEDIAAWKRDEWRYVGVELTLEWLLHEDMPFKADLWGVEWGFLPGAANKNIGRAQINEHPVRDELMPEVFGELEQLVEALSPETFRQFALEYEKTLVQNGSGYFPITATCLLGGMKISLHGDEIAEPSLTADSPYHSRLANVFSASASDGKHTIVVTEIDGLRTRFIFPNGHKMKVFDKNEKGA